MVGAKHSNVFNTNVCMIYMQHDASSYPYYIYGTGVHIHTHTQIFTCAHVEIDTNFICTKLNDEPIIM